MCMKHTFFTRYPNPLLHFAIFFLCLFFSLYLYSLSVSGCPGRFRLYVLKKTKKNYKYSWNTKLKHTARECVKFSFNSLLILLLICQCHNSKRKCIILQDCMKNIFYLMVPWLHYNLNQVSRWSPNLRFQSWLLHRSPHTQYMFHLRRVDGPFSLTHLMAISRDSPRITAISLWCYFTCTCFSHLLLWLQGGYMSASLSNPAQWASPTPL